MLNGMGIETGIDMAKLIAAGQGICDVLGKANESRAARAFLAKQ
jgi:hydroxymethylglutaryl-CoA lyase